MGRWKLTMLAAMTLLAACSARSGGGGDAGFGGGDAGMDPADPQPDAAMEGEERPDADMEDPTAPETDVPSGPTDAIWVNTADALYRFVPAERELMHVGDFVRADGSGARVSMTDMAVDGDGRLFGASFRELFRIDPETAEVTVVGEFDHTAASVNAMSFVGAGVLDPVEEVLLIVDGGGDYYRVSETDAHTVRVGSMIEELRSSGDVVSINAMRTTYAAGKPPGGSHDVLVEFSPDTEEVERIGDTIGYEDVFGLGFQRGELFGFTCGGEVLLLDMETGVGTELTTLEDMCFWGAAVSTETPLI